MISGPALGPALGLVKFFQKVEQTARYRLGLYDVVKGFQLSANRTVRVKGNLGRGVATAASLVFTGLDHGLVSIACRPLSSFCPRFQIASQT